MTELAVVLAAIALAYFVKGVVGMGGPLLAIPVIASVTDVQHAVVVLSLANLISNGWLLWEHRKGAAGTGFVMVPFLTAGTVATVLGTWLLTEVDDRVLAPIVALVIVAYVARVLTDSEWALDRAGARRWATPIGLVGGILVGATGTGGPLVATFLHSTGMSRSSFVLSLSLTFQVFGLIQIATLVGLGAFTGERTVQALWAILPVVAMTPVGIWLGRRVRQPLFQKLVLALLAFAAVRLILTAL